MKWYQNPKILCFAGGVAAALAMAGQRVLCIDMDIGLRNLDISLGLSDRALMDFADVALGRCTLSRAAVRHPDLKELSLLTAPMSLPPSLSPYRVRSMLSAARTLSDYILIDAPAGLGPGFQYAVCGADRALVVATNDASSLRDAQRVVAELDWLDDAMNTAGLPLIGVIPEDAQVMLCANRGIPLTSQGRKGAAMACRNIAWRLMGRRVPIMRIR